MLVNQNAFANFVSHSINQDSIKIYKPWYKQNLSDHIFAGKYSLIFKLLRDYFKTEIKASRKRVSFNGDIETEDIQGFIRRRWKVNSPNYSLDEKSKFLESVKGILSNKQFNSYLKWLSGNYYSSDPNERQNLKRAKDKILSTELDVPIPKIRRKS